MDNKLIILDPSLRDGSHAIGHQLTPEQVSGYVKLVDNAGVNIIEVGHGLGLGASCASVGMSRFSDSVLNDAALNAAINSEICNFVLPGFATIVRNIAPAMDQGINVFRFGTHCTEADLAQKHIEYVVENGGTAMTSLVMSHMTDEQTLLQQAKKFQDYGASSVTLMDSAGAFTLSETRKKISCLVDGLEINIGYHGHNNLGLAVANSIIARESGASILDATARGFGAGAGNTSIEEMIAALHKENMVTSVDLMKLLDASDFAQSHIIQEMPVVTNAGIIGGYYGVCGAFQKHVINASSTYGVPVDKIYQMLADRKAVAGQEDMIIEIAVQLKGELK